MSIKERIFEKEGRKFPGATYSEVVLAPVYEHAKRSLLEPMLAIHKAHLIMLVKQGLLKVSEASQIMEGICALDKDALLQSTYDGQYEDLFFSCGKSNYECSRRSWRKFAPWSEPERYGCCHVQNGTQDKILLATRALLSFQETLLKVSDTYKETIVLGHTHTQQAQPMTFSHYLLGMYDVVDRDRKD
jgi:argininosuccinate lyase